MHQRLLIVRHGIRHWSERWEPLRHGADGNEQTLRYAAKWVREDSNDPTLRAFAENLVSSVAADDVAGRIRKLFEFVRDEIRYVEDPPDVERIADAWRTIEKREGDCGDKSILLASLLGTLGYISRFVVQSWRGDLSNGYDHVHVQVQAVGSGRWAAVSEWVDLDPTNEHAWQGWAAPDMGHAVFEIWPEAVMEQFQISDSRLYDASAEHHLGGLFDAIGPALITTGIQVGSQYASSSAQQSKLSAQQTKAIGAQFDNLASQALQVFQSINARMPYLTADDVAYAQQAYQAVESFVQQNPIDYVTTQWNSAAYKGAAQSDIAKFATAAQAVSSGQVAVGSAPQPATLDFGLGTSIGSSSISTWAIVAVVAMVAVLALRN